MGTAVEIGGVAVYGVLGLVCVYSFLRACCSGSIRSVTTPDVIAVRLIFSVFILLFVMVRFTWVTVEVLTDGNTTLLFVMNRVAFLFFFSAFTLVLFYWAESFHKKYIDNEAFLPQVGVAFVLLNAAVYILQTVLLAIFVADDDLEEGDLLYDMNIFMDVGVFSVVSVGYLCYGILLACRAGYGYGDEELSHKQQELCKIMTSTIIFTLCFSVRVAIFIYRPATNNHLPNLIFYMFGYFIPEFIPSLLQVYIIHSTSRKVERDINFIEELYTQGDESVESQYYQRQQRNRRLSSPIKIGPPPKKEKEKPMQWSNSMENLLKNSKDVYVPTGYSAGDSAETPNPTRIVVRVPSETSSLLRS